MEADKELKILIGLVVKVKVLHQRVPPGPRTCEPFKLGKQTQKIDSSNSTTYGTLDHISFPYLSAFKRVNQIAVGTCWTVGGMPFLPGWITSECPGCC